MFRFAGLVTDQPPAQAVADLSSMLEAMRREASDAIRVRRVPSLRSYLGWISRADAECESDAAMVETDDAILLLSGELFDDRGPVRVQSEHGRESVLARLSDRRSR